MEEKKNVETKDEKISNETAHEIVVAMMERQMKRLFILCIIIFIALVGTNAGWIIYESQFQDTVVSQDIDTGEGDAVISVTGDINYGTDKANSENTP